MQSTVRQTKRPILGWFLSAVIGTVLAWLSSAVVLPMAFGIARKDSASLWMLSGVADLVMGFLCLPAFLLAHGLSFVALRRADTTASRALGSLGLGIIVFWIVLLVAWRLQVNGPVWRAN